MRSSLLGGMPMPVSDTEMDTMFSLSGPAVSMMQPWPVLGIGVGEKSVQTQGALVGPVVECHALDVDSKGLNTLFLSI